MPGFSVECQQAREAFQRSYDAYTAAREHLTLKEKAEQEARSLLQAADLRLSEAKKEFEAIAEEWEKFVRQLTENTGFGLEDMQAGFQPTLEACPDNALVIGPVHTPGKKLYSLWGLAPSREVLTAWSAAAYQACRESEAHQRQHQAAARKLIAPENEWDLVHRESEQALRRSRKAREVKQQAMEGLEKALADLRLTCIGQLETMHFEDQRVLVITPGMLLKKEKQLKKVLPGGDDAQDAIQSSGKYYSLQAPQSSPTQEGAYLQTLNAERQTSYQRITLPDEAPDPDLEELYADLPPLHKKARIPRWVWFLLAALASVIVIMLLL